MKQRIVVKNTKEIIENRLNQLEVIITNNLGDNDVRASEQMERLNGMIEAFRMLGYNINCNINNDGYDTWTISE